MNWSSIVWLALVALLFFWGAGVRARLDQARQHLMLSFDQLRTQLQQRHAMLDPFSAKPLPEKSHFAQSLARVMAARAQVAAACDMVKARQPLHRAIHSLKLAEEVFQSAIPSLLAHVPADMQIRPEPSQDDTSWTPFSEAWREADKRVSYAAQVFNQQADSYNGAVKQWPTRLVSRLLGFTRVPTL